MKAILQNPHTYQNGGRPLTAALYARVSTSEGRQHLENQRRELRLYAARMGWSLYHYEFSDQVTGAAAVKPGLEALMESAARREFDLVLVFDLSRLTRKGPASAFGIIERLKASGVEFVSLREEYFRTTGPAGPLLIAIAAYIAEQERSAISSRVKAGLARAKAEGKIIGRPRVVVDRGKVIQLRGDGFSVRQVAQILRTSRSTVQRIEEEHALDQKENHKKNGAGITGERPRKTLRPAERTAPRDSRPRTTERNADRRKLAG